MMESALISVIVPCYNQGKFLTQALQSVLNQTYTNWECIVINDGSVDTNTESIAQKFVKKDNRYSYIKQTNSGVSAARNAGLNAAKGQYVCFLDADDWLSEKAFGLGMTYAAQDTLVLSQVKSYIETEKLDRDYYYKLSVNDLTFSNILLNFGEIFDIPIHCALISRSLLAGFKFNQELSIGEDWVMWLHIFNRKPKIHIINEPLAWYRKWPNSATMQVTQAIKAQFLSNQFVIKHFDIGYDDANMLNTRIVNKLMTKVETLEHDYQYIRNSTSFRIGYFVAGKLGFIKRLFKAGKFSVKQ